MFNKKMHNSFKRKKLRLARILNRCPNKKSIVIKITISTPRKPNSARRKTVKARYRTNKVMHTYIPGGKHPLKKFSNILIKGSGARDLPGVYSKATRGCLDLPPLEGKTKRRSLYGVPRN